MQSDEEIGKVAAAVPVVISKSLEMFMETLVKKTYDITMKRGEKEASYWSIVFLADFFVQVPVTF